MTAQLIVLDLAAAILVAGSWAAAAVVATGAKGSPQRRARLALGLVMLAAIGLVAEIFLVVVLAQSGWWFVGEKVLLAVPLSLVGAVGAWGWAVPPLFRLARGGADRLTPQALAALVGAACFSAAGIVAQTVLGYPFDLVAAVTLVATVVLATWLAYALFAGGGRRLVSGLGAMLAFVLVASVGFAWLGSLSGPAGFAQTHGHGMSGGEPLAGSESTSVDDLRTPADSDRNLAKFELTAETQTITLDSGRTVEAWSFGSVPGPELRVNQGDLVEVTLNNRDIAEGVTLHWHGVDLPNGEDGVAGVTQDAVRPGESFTYRFVAEEPGSYWYHTHQSSARGIQRGLFGSLVVLPPGGLSEDLDVTIPVHTLGRAVLLGESDGETPYEVAEGETVRARLINTDQLPRRFRVVGTDFRVVAADGRDLLGPTTISDVALRIPAGGRIDVTFTMPSAGVRITSDSSRVASVSFSTDGREPTGLEEDRAARDLDLLSYGEPTTPRPPTGEGTVDATMVLDRLPRFMQGRPIQGYTVNGEVFPQIESIDVDEGNLVVLTVANRNWETHPMHIHGHHVLVLSRNGVAASGSPLWLDTFDVQPGETWKVAFLADNPGIWMDHCHNLEHAVEGMMMALRYSGITSPYVHGGEHGNSPE